MMSFFFPNLYCDIFLHIKVIFLTRKLNFFGFYGVHVALNVYLELYVLLILTIWKLFMFFRSIKLFFVVLWFLVLWKIVVKMMKFVILGSRTHQIQITSNGARESPKTYRKGRFYSNNSDNSLRLNKFQV